MRPAGRAETDSLYFDYPYFDAPPDRDRLSEHAPVAIVGAGPVGMTAALGNV
jgi:3-(3-hydroxy-phenyl)propionate hydroxylase